MVRGLFPERGKQNSVNEKFSFTLFHSYHSLLRVYYQLASEPKLKNVLLFHMLIRECATDKCGELESVRGMLDVYHSIIQKEVLILRNHYFSRVYTCLFVP